MAERDPTITYFTADFMRTLFPLDTNRFVIERAPRKLREATWNAGSRSRKAQPFGPQTPATAAKANAQPRKTLKLDPAAEFFLYELTYRHKRLFRSKTKDRRQRFGFSFRGQKMVSSGKSFRAFRSSVLAAAGECKFGLKTDIAMYFNTLGREDLLRWFSQEAGADADVNRLEQFLLQTSEGRKADCLPQGIFPGKALGNQFLQFVEESDAIRSLESRRFMDDIYLFDQKRTVIERDFAVLKDLLREHGLTLNADKTKLAPVSRMNLKKKLDPVRSGLMKRRGDILMGSGGDDAYDDHAQDEDTLSDEETEYLLNLLHDPELDEEDAALTLALLRKQSDQVIERIEEMLVKFPSLSKDIYHFAVGVRDRTSLLSVIRKFVADAPAVGEYQLFWLARVCQKVLPRTRGVADVLISLFSHNAATPISKGKVLEIPLADLDDLRATTLVSSGADWLAWCSAVGATSLPKAARKRLLKSFKKESWLNALIAECVASSR